MNQSKVHGLGPGPPDWVFPPALLGALEDAFNVGSIIQAKVQVCGDELQTIVPDFKPFLKKLDEHFDSIIDFPDRADRHVVMCLLDRGADAKTSVSGTIFVNCQNQSAKTKKVP